MIIYDLICDLHHEFEGWFADAADWDQQNEQSLLTCPVCESSNVVKKPAAPKISKKSNTAAASDNPKLSQNLVSGSDQSPEKFNHLQNMLRKVHDYVDDNFEDVGNQFCSEAISMHRGEKNLSNIRGTASKKQLKEMAEEGVAAVPLPPKPIDKDKIN